MAWRTAVEHPNRVTRVPVIDIVPLPYSNVTREFATEYFHWFFLIQPAPFPETLIGNNAEFYLRSRFLRSPAATSTFTADAIAQGTSAASRSPRRFMPRAKTIGRARPSMWSMPQPTAIAKSRARSSCCGASAGQSGGVRRDADLAPARRECQGHRSAWWTIFCRRNCRRRRSPNCSRSWESRHSHDGLHRESAVMFASPRTRRSRRYR